MQNKNQEKELDEETLRNLYVRGKWSAKRIGDKYGLGISKVFRLIHKYGIARPDEPIEHFQKVKR